MHLQAKCVPVWLGSGQELRTTNDAALVTVFNVRRVLRKHFLGTPLAREVWSDVFTAVQKVPAEHTRVICKRSDFGPLRLVGIDI